MTILRNLLAIFILSFLFTSCEKEIKINLSEREKLLVVEGVIETNQQPYVTLTKSIGFFETIDFNSINYVKNAIVHVQDVNTGTEILLKEYSVDTVVGTQHFFFNVYGPDILDPVAFNFKGQEDHTYKLSIETEGKFYESYTKIPFSKGLDSVWVEPVPGKEDSFSVLKGLYSDPDTFGNSVRVETKNNRYVKDGSPEIFLTSFNSVYNDDIVNGVKLPVSIDLGYDKTKNYNQSDFQTLGFVRKGDTVTLKWSAIDRKVFKFWETLSYSQGSIGNPFASPTKIQSNVPNALGVWAGYGAKYYTIIDSL